MSNTNLIFMTTAKAKPGKEQEVFRALSEVAEAARAQPDCIDCRILRSTEDAATTINFEQWSSEAEREAFLAGPAVEKFVAAISGAFVQSPQPVSYQELDVASH
jgi:quinol monooxygenase YgiN